MHVQTEQLHVSLRNRHTAIYTCTMCARFPCRSVPCLRCHMHTCSTMCTMSAMPHAHMQHTCTHVRMHAHTHRTSWPSCSGGSAITILMRTGCAGGETVFCVHACMRMCVRVCTYAQHGTRHCSQIYAAGSVLGPWASQPLFCMSCSLWQESLH